VKSLIRLCFRRPVGVGAVTALLVALAVVAALRLPVALLPDLGYPALTVWTAYPDVPPERVERTVTEPVEEAVAGTEGIERVTARSQLGGSLVELRFGWNTDLDRALLSVREQLNRLGDRLPEAAEDPVVLRVDPSERPIMMIALRGAGSDSSGVRQAAVSGGGRQDLVRLREVGQEVVARRLEQLSGVARVRVTGGHRREVEVNVDEDRLAALGIGMGAVEAALRRANVSLPGGTLRRGPFRYAVEVSGEFRGVEDIASTVIGRAEGRPVRLRDVATTKMGIARRRGLVRYDGREALLLLVERRPDANTVQAAAEVRDALGGLEAELGRVRLDVVVDESVFIEKAIGGVVQAVLLGGVLAVAVLFGFLRRRRPLVAVGVAVPLSLALALVGFDLMGVTFNMIALSGLALGVGLLVDNAIVVVENVARLREEGLGPVEAARQGTEEVAGAIAASTLTTISVFLPITFVEGLAGRLFRDQSLAVVASLLASLLVAITVVPLIVRRGEGGAGNATGHAGGGGGAAGEEDSAHLVMDRLLSAYERALRWCLDRPPVVLGAAALVLAGAGALAWALPREVVPAANRGRVEAHLTMAPGTGLSVVDRRAGALARTAREQVGAAHVLADVGERSTARLELDPRPPYEGDLTVILPDSIEAQQAAGRLQAAALPQDATVEVRPAQTRLEELLSPADNDLVIDLIAERRALARGRVDTLVQRLRASRALSGVRRAEAAAVPAYRLRLDREAMARTGVEPDDVGRALEAAARGRRATALRQVGEEVPIVLHGADVTSIEALLRRTISTAEGRLPLRRFAEAERVDLPAALLRAGQAPVVRLVADVAEGTGLSAAVTAARADLDAALPAGVRARVGGANRAFRESLRAVGWSLLLSLLLVYLILTAQFGHLRQPLVILAAVPLAAAGVVLTLWAAGQTVNLMSLTGCVVLVGIVVNDAIIKVDFINQRRRRGRGLREAILSAGRARFRPILMTTLTTVLGLLPLALGLGAGAEIRAPLAIAVVGGLLSATVLTLLVVPVLYQILARSRKPSPQSE
jgi:HAE1 family hydrophobic/amphiphilic exporter-1